MGLIRFTAKACLDNKRATSVIAPYNGICISTVGGITVGKRTLAMIVESQECELAQESFLRIACASARQRLETLGFTDRQIKWIEGSQRIIRRLKWYYPSAAHFEPAASGHFKRDSVLFRTGTFFAVSALLHPRAGAYLAPGQYAALKFYDLRGMIILETTGLVSIVEPGTSFSSITISIGKLAKNRDLTRWSVDVEVNVAALGGEIRDEDFWRSTPAAFCRFDPQLEPRPINYVSPRPPSAPKEDLHQRERRERYLLDPLAYFDRDVEPLICAATISRAFVSQKQDLAALRGQTEQLINRKFGERWIEFPNARVNLSLRAMQDRGSISADFNTCRIDGKKLCSETRAIIGLDKSKLATPVSSSLSSRSGFSDQQSAAIRAIQQWWRRNSTEPFLLYGYAGSGKTTVAIELMNALPCKVAYCAFTGKAASVLVVKGCSDATTIHQGMYRYVPDERGNWVSFINRDGYLGAADVIVVEECSMVSQTIGRDLMSLNKPIIAVGDPFQLPPIDGEGFFGGKAPNVLLDQIHRQAKDSPILRLAEAVRLGARPKIGGHEEAKVVDCRSLPIDRILQADQLLAGKRHTCENLNRAIRDMHGRTDCLPEPEDKLICRRNNHALGLHNGQIWNVLERGQVKPGSIELRLVSENGHRARQFVCASDAFTNSKQSMSYDPQLQFFEFGYALTVHQCQGSEYEETVVFDESDTHSFDPQRWLYSAVTRARKRLTLIKKPMAFS